MIKIPKIIFKKLVQHARREIPYEACGYLAGTDTEVKQVFLMTNVDKSSQHFSFDPKEQFDVLKKAGTAGLDLIAVYHSHPETPARPSPEDIKLAYDPNKSYVIISLANKKLDIKSFKINKRKVKREEIEVINNE